MFFFGENLQPQHRLTLWLVLGALLANGYLFSHLCEKISFLDVQPELELVTFNMVHITLVFGIFVKMLVLCIFRKF